MRSARELQDLLPLIREHCDPAEYEACAKAIASVVAEISLGLQKTVFENNPEVKAEVEEAVTRYGVYT